MRVGHGAAPMNPLSDWFVDDRAIVDHQQRLLDEAGYRTLPSGQIDATASRRAAWAWRFIVVAMVRVDEYLTREDPPASDVGDRAELEGLARQQGVGVSGHHDHFA